MPQTSSTVCQSIGTATGPASVAIGSRWSSEPWPSASVWSTQKTRTPCSARSRSRPGLVRALGQPEAAASSPRRSGARARRRRAPTCSRRPASVASSGSTACVAVEVQSSVPSAANAAEQVAAAALERLVRAHVVARGAAQLGRQLGLAGGVEPGRVLGVDRRADLAQEAQEAVAGLAAHRLELVAQHRRQAERHRRALEHVEQRQVDARDRLPQPLLAERPGAEALDVGHVRVEDERERAAVAAHLSTATKSSARSSGPCAERSPLVDRGREPVVEALRDPELRVERSPSPRAIASSCSHSLRAWNRP